jgi:hypothetical protein
VGLGVDGSPIPADDRPIMTTVKTRIRVASDGTLSGKATGLPVGDHDAEIVILDAGTSPAGPGAAALLARVQAIQAEVARLPVLDGRSPDEILGYNQRGHLD